MGPSAINPSAAEAAGKARMRRAFKRLGAPWVIVQAVLAAGTFALGVLWLEIPDQTGAQITLSFTVALCAALVVPWAQSYVFILVRRRKRDEAAAWKGALLLLGLALIYWAVAAFFEAGAVQDASRAARWSLRPAISDHLSADSLMALQAAVWFSLRCLVLVALLPFAMEGAATGLRGRWLTRAAWLLLEPLYWSVSLACALTAGLLTTGLLNLRPHLPLLLEILLTALRVALIFAIDLGALCYALSFTATFLRDAQRVMPAQPATPPGSLPLR